VTATAAPQASKHWPASIYRRPDGSVERRLSPAQLRDIVRAGEGELWVDVDSNDLHQHALLGFKAKRSTFGPRRHLGPLREVLNILTDRPCGYIRPEIQIVWWLKHRQWL
jgi:hypothetical protein